MFFGAAIIPIENKESKGGRCAHPLTIFIFYGAYVFAQKTPEACPINLVVDSAGGGDFEFSFWFREICILHILGEVRTSPGLFRFIKFIHVL